jgi:hypothetical protein
MDADQRRGKASLDHSNPQHHIRSQVRMAQRVGFRKIPTSKERSRRVNHIDIEAPNISFLRIPNYPATRTDQFKAKNCTQALT